MVYRGPRLAVAGAEASSPPGPSSNSSAHTPAAWARLARLVPLPGSPSPFRLIGPPGRPPPEMVAPLAPLAWAAVGTTASRSARTSMARTRRCGRRCLSRCVRRCMMGPLPATELPGEPTLPGGPASDRTTPQGRGRFPSAVVDEHGGADGELGEPAVHGGGGHADAAVTGRERGDRVGAVEGVAAGEVGRAVEEAELAAAPGVDLALDHEAALGGDGQADVAVDGVGLAGG